MKLKKLGFKHREVTPKDQANTITSHYAQDITNDIIIMPKGNPRYYSHIEVERLMGFKDNYTEIDGIGDNSKIPKTRQRRNTGSCRIHHTRSIILKFINTTITANKQGSNPLYTALASRYNPPRVYQRARGISFILLK